MHDCHSHRELEENPETGKSRLSQCKYSNAAESWHFNRHIRSTMPWSYIFVSTLSGLWTRFARTVTSCRVLGRMDASSSYQPSKFPINPLLHLLPRPGGLSHLGHTALPPLLCGFRTRFGIHHLVPPPKAAGVVAYELLVVHIVPLGSTPAGEEVVQAPWEFVSAVCVDGLEQAENDPGIHSQNMQVAGDGAPEDR